MSMNIAILWNNRLADLSTAWSMFITLTEIKLIIDLKILNSKIKEHMIKLEQFVVGKILRILLGLTNPDVLNRGLGDRIEENHVNATFPATFTLNKWTIAFFGMNPDMVIV